MLFLFQDTSGAVTGSHSIDIFLMVFVAFLLGLLLGYLLWHHFKAKHDELENKYNGLHSRHTDLEKDHASLKYKHDELEKDNKAHRSRVRSLEADNAILTGKLEKMEASISGGDMALGATAQGIGAVAAAVDPDDLKKVEGIGPKIEGLLNAAGIHTWKQLSEAVVETLQGILNDAGSRYKMHNPTTWPKQAELAHAGKWDELKEYQDFLQGGKDPS